MTTAEAKIITDFQPLNPSHLADPKFESYSTAAREVEMANLVRSRCFSTLSFVRPILVASIGRSFMEMGWICEEDLDSALQEARSRLQQHDPKKAAFVFRSVAQNDNASESGMSI